MDQNIIKSKPAGKVENKKTNMLLRESITLFGGVYGHVKLSLRYNWNFQHASVRGHERRDNAHTAEKKSELGKHD